MVSFVLWEHEAQVRFLHPRPKYRIKMDKNLQSYIKFFHNAMDSNLLSRTLTELSVVKYITHSYYDHNTGKSNSYEDDLDIYSNVPAIDSTDEIMKIIWNCYREYINNLNFIWFDSWKAYSLVRFNKYSVGTNMKLHCDHIHSLFDGPQKGVPILTALGALNDDYEGGELTIFDDYKVDLKGGDIVIFPSNFLFPHKVSTITKGTRHSLVSWAW